MSIPSQEIVKVRVSNPANWRKTVLLEKAAKAAGGKIKAWGANDTPLYPFGDGADQLFWHPGRNTSDMVKLAAKLGMRIDFRLEVVECDYKDAVGENHFIAHCWGDVLGTVNDAVLRVAAEIGDLMP